MVDEAYLKKILAKRTVYVYLLLKRTVYVLCRAYLTVILAREVRMLRMVRRVLLVALAGVVGLLSLLATGFAVSQWRLSTADVHWATELPTVENLAAADVPVITTMDADGSMRLTQVWIAALDNTLYLRTGASRWLANLQRGSALVLRAEERSYPCSATRVHDPDTQHAVHAAFHTKYPKRSSFFRSIGISTNNVLALQCQIRQQVPDLFQG